MASTLSRVISDANRGVIRHSPGTGSADSKPTGIAQPAIHVIEHAFHGIAVLGPAWSEPVRGAFDIGDLFIFAGGVIKDDLIGNDEVMARHGHDQQWDADSFDVRWRAGTRRSPINACN